ncbi:hypothetical protein XELAEV_18034883mg [Xenopus laevis]|uniref:Mid2 domain-containing protein n=1 Tax=Xenopus laevis TaxID=8355 RepID=A0A974CGV5_XENLA|nr:hypothetical protein XELAEV_18034883mg [Xenopus laevis]
MPINDLADKMYDDSNEDESKSSRSLDATTQASSTDTDTISETEKMQNMIIIGCVLGFGCLLLIVVPCCLVCFISHLKKDELSQAEEGKIGS